MARLQKHLERLHGIAGWEDDLGVWKVLCDDGSEYFISAGNVVDEKWFDGMSVWIWAMPGKPPEWIETTNGRRTDYVPSST